MDSSTIVQASYCLRHAAFISTKVACPDFALCIFQAAAVCLELLQDLLRG
jgi:hypothetical protein